jgi:hypothetical protein
MRARSAGIGSVGAADTSRRSAAATEVRWVDWYRQDYGAVAYTVLSFDMPIAWLVDRYWVVVTHFVSQPTKRHQQVARGLVYLHER